jgi:hypothetical protein
MVTSPIGEHPPILSKRRRRVVKNEPEIDGLSDRVRPFGTNTGHTKRLYDHDVHSVNVSSEIVPARQTRGPEGSGAPVPRPGASSSRSRPGPDTGTGSPWPSVSGGIEYSCPSCRTRLRADTRTGIFSAYCATGIGNGGSRARSSAKRVTDHARRPTGPLRVHAGQPLPELGFEIGAVIEATTAEEAALTQPTRFSTMPFMLSPTRPAQLRSGSRARPGQRLRSGRSGRPCG